MYNRSHHASIRPNVLWAVAVLGAVLASGFIFPGMADSGHSPTSRRAIHALEPRGVSPVLPAGANPQMSPYNQKDPCAMFRGQSSPMQLCLPVKLFVKDSVEEKHKDTYCDPPGISPCNEKEYVAYELIFGYEAEASGVLVHNKDLSNFFVNVNGSPEQARINKIQGYKQWYTTTGSGNKQWHKRTFPQGPVTVRNPVGLSIFYPAGEDSKWNLQFGSLEIGSNDDEMPTHDGSDLGSETVGQGPTPWMIKPQEMKQIIAAGGFTKTFKWRETQPGGKATVDYEITLRLEIGEPCQEKIEIAIRTQDGQDKYCFSEGTPGKLEFTLTADVTPGGLADEVTWTVPDLAGSIRTISPASGKGRTIKVTYTGLPQNNSDFGPKKITAVAKKDRCQGQAEKEVRFFFPVLAKNNPGGAEPNWYYYWKQTSACVGPIRFGGDSIKCQAGPGGHDLGYYRSAAFDTFYNICDLKNLGANFPFGSWTGKGQDIVPQPVTGIDTFAVACLHENAHYTHAMQWWKKCQTLDKFEDTDQNGIKDDKEKQLDKDGDLVPDALEKGFGLDPKNKYSKDPSHTFDDEEILCCAAEATWKIGKADKEDWSKPGKQWK